MKTQLAVATLFATSIAYAANFGGGKVTVPANTTATSSGGAAAIAPNVVIGTRAAVAGPQAGDLFRVVKTNGATVIMQGSMNVDVNAAPVLTVSEADALAKGNGRCAFNVKYDEYSDVAAAGTTTRLFSNGTLVANNTMIDLVPGVVKTVWTQPYLFAGMNNVSVVVNATGAAPSTKSIRVNVLGSCGGTNTTTATTSTTAATTTTTMAPVTTTMATTTTTARPTTTTTAAATTTTTAAAVTTTTARPTTTTAATTTSTTKRPDGTTTSTTTSTTGRPVTTTSSTTTTKRPETSTTTTTTTKRPETTATTTTTTAAVRFGPGTGEWNNLFNAYGYSNYAVTQLRGKGYPRYDELVKLNALLVAAVEVKSIERNAYNSLMTSWNGFVTDPTFQSMMAAIVKSPGIK